MLGNKTNTSASAPISAPVSAPAPLLVAQAPSRTPVSSQAAFCPLEELLMKKGLIANSLTEHPLMIRLRETLAEKSGGSAALFTDMERFIRDKQLQGDRYLLRADFSSLLSEKASSMSQKEIDQLFNAFSSDKPDALFSDEFYMALKGPMSSKRREILDLTFQQLDYEGKRYIDPGKECTIII